MNKLTSILAILFLFLGGIKTTAQIRIEIDKMPELLVPEQGLFFASSINSWNPGDPNYKFRKTQSGAYYIELPDSLKLFEYKITQGTWTTAEGDAEGKARPNRIYDETKESDPKRVKLSIANWEQKVAYEFRLTDIPENTPHDATFYITGNFNNWNPRDERYKLTKQNNGQWRVKVYSDLDKIEYKFTRGNWESVEGRENGRGRPNRILLTDKASVDGVQATVKSWEDMPRTFNTLSFYDVLLLCSAIMGVLAVLIISNIENYDRQANQWLIILLLMTSGFIASRVLGANREFVAFFPKILLIPDFILLTYAPVFSFYVRKLLFSSENLPSKWRWHFSFFILQILAYFPLMIMDNTSLVIEIINQTVRIQTLFVIVGAIGLAVNIAYWFNLRGLITHYKRGSHTSYSYDENLHFLNSVMFIKAVCLFLGLCTSLIFIYGWVYNVDVFSAVERCLDLIWFIFSTTPFVLGYFAIYKSKIVKLSTGPISVNAALPGGEVHTVLLSEKKHDDAMDEVVMKQLKDKLENYMEHYKPYINPNLSINDLAAKLKIHPHVLSRVINECYQKNFFYFINEYRIDEFKRKLEDPEYKKYKLLSIAYEVGFNSKSAFNRSFKKLTNYSPSEYFASRKLEDCELSQQAAG